MSTRLINTIVVFSILILSSLFFRGCCVTFVDNHELGYSFDMRTGNLDTLSGKGYFIHPPIVVKIHTIDTRPFQVCINANNRVLNCKLVQFDSNGFYQFISLHGRDDYSVNPSVSSQSNYGNLYEIMKSYAYEKKNFGNSNTKSNYPFLKILKEINDDENFENLSRKDTL